MNERAFESKKLIIQSYSEKAEDYAVFVNAHPGFKELREKITKMLMLSSGAKVLDLGAGTCHYGLGFLAYGCEVLCLDISKKMVRAARQKDAHVIVGDIEKLPIKGGCVDAAICVNALRYVDAETLIKEIKRILKPKGKMLLVDGDRNRVQAARLNRTLRKHELERMLLKKGLIRIYSCDELKSLLERCGCTVEAAEHFRIYILLRVSV
ncbi:class I SAM-dependent methyltransferase [Candidatus Alkanophaga liquidiphilum]